MLCIKETNEVSAWHTTIWHLGDPIPDQKLYPVVTFEADGHELLMILEAMRTARIYKNNVVVGPPIVLTDYENYYGPGKPID